MLVGGAEITIYTPHMFDMFHMFRAVWHPHTKIGGDSDQTSPLFWAVALRSWSISPCIEWHGGTANFFSRRSICIRNAAAIAIYLSNWFSKQAIRICIGINKIRNQPINSWYKCLLKFCYLLKEMESPRSWPSGRQPTKCGVSWRIIALNQTTSPSILKMTMR